MWYRYEVKVSAQSVRGGMVEPEGWWHRVCTEVVRLKIITNRGVIEWNESMVPVRVNREVRLCSGWSERKTAKCKMYVNENQYRGKVTRLNSGNRRRRPTQRTKRLQRVNGVAGRTNWYEPGSIHERRRKRASSVRSNAASATRRHAVGAVRACGKNAKETVNHVAARPTTQTKK